MLEVVVSGMARVEEMRKLAQELEAAVTSLRGAEIKVCFDLRTMHPAPPEVTAILGEAQAFMTRAGVSRLAEIVSSEVLALQLQRVAHESGAEKILRRFWEEGAARAWVADGDPSGPPSRRPPPR